MTNQEGCLSEMEPPHPGRDTACLSQQGQVQGGNEMPSWPGVELTRPAFPGHEAVLARCEPASAALAVAREGSRPAHVRDHPDPSKPKSCRHPRSTLLDLVFRAQTEGKSFPRGAGWCRYRLRLRRAPARARRARFPPCAGDRGALRGGSVSQNTPP